MFQDLRYAARLVRRHPLFSATVVATLALGVGLTTAMFSIVNGVLLKPLPYAQPSALVTARSVSSEELIEWRARTAALTGIAAYDFGVPPLLLADDETVRLRQAAVSVDLLSVLGVRPIVGRDFHAEDSAPSAEPVAILTYGAWQQHFGGRADIVGTVAPFEPAGRRIIGVLPPDFMFPMRFISSVGHVRMLTPIAMPPRPGYTFGAVARLASGATIAHAQAEAGTILRQAEPSTGVPLAAVVPLPPV